MSTVISTTWNVSVSTPLTSDFSNLNFCMLENFNPSLGKRKALQLHLQDLFSIWDKKLKTLWAASQGLTWNSVPKMYLAVFFFLWQMRTDGRQRNHLTARQELLFQRDAAIINVVTKRELITRLNRPNVTCISEVSLLQDTRLLQASESNCLLKVPMLNSLVIEWDFKHWPPPRWLCGAQFSPLTLRNQEVIFCKLCKDAYRKLRLL